MDQEQQRPDLSAELSNTQVSPILWLDERCMRHITHTDILTLIRLYKWYVYYSPREAS